MADYIYTMEIRLTPDQQRGVTLVQEVARAAELNIYLSGGTIRDIISGFPIRDLDLTLQGDPFKLQKDLEKAGAKVQGHDEDTRSLYLVLPGNVRAELSMARSERYEKTGKPPVIAPATISEDLRRRDFTINAMALSLNPGSRGLLLDPFNGVADIEAKLLRILHNYAFLEDPSRLIRVTRFAARFHWAVEERTQARYDAAKENNYIEHITNRAIGKEIERLAYEDDPLHILRTLEKEGWLKVLNPHWSTAKVDTSDLGQLMKTRQQMVEAGYTVDTAPAALYFLTARLSHDDIATMQRLIPRKDLVESWRNLEVEAKELAKRLSGKEAATASRTWQLLSSARPETILFLDLTTKQQGVSQKLKNFFGKWRQVRQKLPFPEMAEMRITPSLPDYPKVEQEAFLLLLDGKLRSRTEIMNFLKPYSPPPPPPPPPPPKRGRAAKAVAATAGGAKSVETKKPVETKPAVQTKTAVETKKKGKEAAPVAPPPPMAAKKALSPDHKKPAEKPSKAAPKPVKKAKQPVKKPAGKKR